MPHVPRPRQKPIDSTHMHSSSLLRRPPLFSIVGALLILCLAVGSSPAYGQYWQQTARIVTPIEDDGIRAFLDTLIHEIEDQGLRVRRAPDQTDRMTLSALRANLIEEHGIGVTTANTVLIRYEFRIDFGNNLQQTIRSVQFQLRFPPMGPYIRVLHLDAQQPWMKKILAEKGTHMLTNEAAVIPFRQRLRFSRLIQWDDTRLVEIGDETIREGFSRKKEALFRKIRYLAYGLE